MEELQKTSAILVADSGSTKTDWALLIRDEGRGMRDEGRGMKDECPWRKFQTQGLNPLLMSDEGLAVALRDELMPHLAACLSRVGTAETPSATATLEVFFYGAGVRPGMEEKVQQAFRQASLTTHPLPPITYHPSPTIHAASDLLGAARTLCGHHEGIACILGTGANSCLFDGHQIVQNTPALGFILGDEGGGAALGKRFLNAIFKGQLPSAMRDDYLAQTGLTLEDIIRKVYREPMANRFLASTSLYIGAHAHHPALRELIVHNFRDFFRRNIVPYGRPDLPVGFVGSIASHYEPLLREAAALEDFTVGTIVKSPIDHLCKYHLAEIG